MIRRIIDVISAVISRIVYLVYNFFQCLSVAFSSATAYFIDCQHSEIAETIKDEDQGVIRHIIMLILAITAGMAYWIYNFVRCLFGTVGTFFISFFNCRHNDTVEIDTADVLTVKVEED